MASGQRLNLVTGGGGFIGGHLVRALIARGEAVRVLDLAPLPDDLPPGVDYRRASILDRAAVDDALAGAGRLYHLAANPDLWAADKHDFMETNYEGTRIVLSAAEAHGRLERVVHTSTESILKTARVRRSTAISETSDRPEEGDMPGAYCHSKFRAEAAARAAQARDLPLVIVNPTLPVGPGDRRLTPPTAMIKGLLDGTIRAYLECVLNFAPVEDIALGHILAADRGRPGAAYILGGANMRMSDFVALLGQVSGRRMPCRRVPYPLAYAAGVVSEWFADHVTHRQPLAPLAGVILARTPSFFTSRRARDELGYRPTPVRDALAREVAWLEGKGVVPGRSGLGACVDAPGG